MINCFAVQYRPATEHGGARFTVRRIDDGQSKTVPYDYGHSSAAKKAVHDAFGDDVARLEYVGDLNKSTKLYAITH